MLTKEETKKLAAITAMQYVQSGMTIGVGTGSTVFWFIQELAARVQQGFVCRAVPTSKETSILATQSGVNMLSLNEVDKIDVTIDGADELDHRLSLIKGGGGALLQEKMVAAASDKMIVIADSSKLVNHLGAFPLPVEVIPYGWKQVQHRIQTLYKVVTSLRMKADQPLLTDHGHYILDCRFVQINDAKALNIQLNTIPGVVDNGLFLQMADKAIVGCPDGQIIILSAPVNH